MGQRKTAIEDIAIAYLLQNAGLLKKIEFCAAMEALQLADALAQDLHVRESEGTRDLVDIDAFLVDRLALWRADIVDDEESDPAEEDDPAEIDDHPEYDHHQTLNWANSIVIRRARYLSKIAARTRRMSGRRLIIGRTRAAKVGAD